MQTQRQSQRGRHRQRSRNNTRRDQELVITTTPDNIEHRAEYFTQLKTIFLDLHRLPQSEQECRLAAMIDLQPKLVADLKRLLKHNQDPIPSLRDECLDQGPDRLASWTVLLAADNDQVFADLVEEDTLQNGDVIGGFTVLREIGRGGMGIVYEAEQSTPKRRVALKVMRPAVLTTTLLRRFQKEAEVLGRLQHPGIARIYEAGVDRNHGQPKPFLAMELINGTPLCEYANAANLTTDERLDILAELCDAIHHAHQQGVIHRDLKPENILVDDQGRIKVLDFGIARTDPTIAQTLTDATQQGQFLGTVAYMSPEQIHGANHAIDVRSDVYSLGVVAFELISNELPITVRDRPLHESARMVTSDPPRRLGSINRAWRGDVDTVLQKALAKETDRRYETAAQFGADIRRARANEPIHARPASSVYQFRKFAQRNRTAVVSSVCAVVVAMLALVIALIISIQQIGFAKATNEQSLRQADCSHLAAAAASLELGHHRTALAYLDQIPVERRGWVWNYLRHAKDRSSAMFRTSAMIRAARMSSDGSTILTIDDDDAVQRWSTQTSSCVETDHLPIRRTGRLCVSAAGDRAAYVIGDDRRSIALVDLRDCTTVTRFLAFEQAIQGIQMSTDGQMIAAHDGKNIRLWNREQPMKEPLEFATHSAGVMAFSNDGRFLFCNEPRGGWRKRIHRLRTEDLTVDGVHRTNYAVLAMTPLEQGNKLIVGTRRKATMIADFNDDSSTHAEIHRGAVTAIARHTTTGAIVTGSEDQTVCLWNTNEPDQRVTFFGFEKPLKQVDVTADGAWVLGTDGNVVRVWHRDAEPAPITLRDHTSYAYGVRYFRGGKRLLSVAWDNRVHIRDAASGELCASFTNPRGMSVIACAAPDDGDFFVVASEDQMYVRHADTGTIVHSVSPPDQNPIMDLDVSRDGTLCALLTTRTIAVFDTSSWTELWSASTGRRASNHFGAVAFAPDTRTLAVEGEESALLLLDAREGTIEQSLTGLNNRINAIAFSNNGQKIAAGGSDGIIALWNVDDGALEKELLGHFGDIYTLAYAPDDAVLASGADDASVRIWDVHAGLEKANFSEHNEYVFDLAWSPDGATLASASGDATIRLWDTHPASWRAQAAGERRRQAHLVEAFVAAELDQSDSPIDVATLIRKNASLNEKEKETALQVLLQFCSEHDATPPSDP